MNNITDQELMNEYVLLSKHEYMGSIKALQAIDIIDGILPNFGTFSMNT